MDLDIYMCRGTGLGEALYLHVYYGISNDVRRIFRLEALQISRLRKSLFSQCSTNGQLQRQHEVEGPISSFQVVPV